MPLLVNVQAKGEIGPMQLDLSRPFSNVSRNVTSDHRECGDVYDSNLARDRVGLQCL